jgi:LmbE family N-acetylglucosaminyl deacetylase
MIKLETIIPRRVLVIAAHPDDIEFGGAGAVAMWTDAGAEVIYCLVTDGAAGSNDATVIYSELVERRKAEQRQAAEIVGVREVIHLDYPDGMLQPTLELRRDLTRLIRRFKPDRVLISDPTSILLQAEGFDYINHPDHRAAAEAALYAIFPSAETRPIFPELLEEGFEPHHVEEVYMSITERPNVAVDISPVMDRKIQSLLSHRSQLDESVVDMVRGWDRMTGEQVGVEFAEAYRVMRFVDEPRGDKAVTQPE